MTEKWTRDTYVRADGRGQAIFPHPQLADIWIFEPGDMTRYTVGFTKNVVIFWVGDSLHNASWGFAFERLRTGDGAYEFIFSPHYAASINRPRTGEELGYDLSLAVFACSMLCYPTVEFVEPPGLALRRVHAAKPGEISG